MTTGKVELVYMSENSMAPPMTGRTGAAAGIALLKTASPLPLCVVMYRWSGRSWGLGFDMMRTKSGRSDEVDSVNPNTTTRYLYRIYRNNYVEHV